ncbi:MAG: prepilin-type N-terminal cleavage/methylation domain-containing protein [Phycisphaeraceae bacterium]|nr:prepilin-type N-terminal cleavage/methylation domain-containing protein [Phycisphaeraceae bacterium]
MSDSRQSSRRAAGFTLIELLVVITIIAILVSLTLAAGTKVVSVGRERGTQWALQALDTSVGEYIQANGAIPAATVRDPLNANKRVPIIDGSIDVGAPTLQKMDSTAWYVYQLQSEGSSALEAIQQIDPRLRKTGIVKTADAKSDFEHTGVRTTQILDVWGNPMHYVHPRFGGIHGVGTGTTEILTDVLGTAPTGIQYGFNLSLMTGFSRDPAPVNLPTGKTRADYKNDADGGTAPSRRPYFYSAGPDGDPSTTDDNVYTIRPNLPR